MVGLKIVVHLLVSGIYKEGVQHMKYLEHLLELTNHFTTGQATETSIATIAGILNCSDRHVKTIVQSLQSDGMIEWVTQRGRGKKPKLTIRMKRNAVLMIQAKLKIGTLQYKEAFSLIESLDQEDQEDFYKWFTTNLGFVQKKEDHEQKLDVFRYPFYETRLVMDPLWTTSRHDAHMVQQVFDRLVEYDPVSNQLKPSIAHHWETKEGECWTFYLHKGITFHHGRELTSTDVQATFARLMAERDLFPTIEKINVCNQTVIQFKLKEVDYLFPRSLASTKASIVPIELVRDNSERFKNYPVGSGPYRLTLHDENLVRLEVNQTYFSERPWLDQVDIIKTPYQHEPEVGHPFLLYAPDASWRQVKRVEDGASYISFNGIKEGPIHQEALRKSICERLLPADIRNEGLDKEIVATSFIWNRSQQSNLETSENNDSFSYNGPALRIAAQQIRPGANHLRAAKQLQAQLQTMGMESTIDLVDASQISSSENLAKYDLFVCGILLGEDRLLSLLATIQSSRFTIYPTLDDRLKKIIDEKIKEIRTLKEESTRWDIYFEIEELLKVTNSIFFLNHRYHAVYEPNDSLYEHIQLDSNGRVDYRKVWKKWE